MRKIMVKKISHMPSFLLCLLTLILYSYSPAFSNIDTGGDDLPLVNIDVTLDIGHGRINGQASVKLPAEKSVCIHLDHVEPDRVTLAGQTIEPAIEDNSFRIMAHGKNSVLRIRFHRDFPSLNMKTGAQGNHDMSGSYMDASGVVLLDGWCPTLDGFARYKLKACVPEDFEAMSEADAVHVVSMPGFRTYTFEFPHPRTGLSLIAGPYEVTLKQHNNIEIASYFFPEDRELVQEYLKKAKTYLDLYEELLGDYPFKRFAIVENRAPTGYGLPTYTLLGQDVVRLPFIVDTSLGHEILHSWFGNSVYVDTESGNWCEGLTTYLADQLYEEQKGLGHAYRHRLLVDYQSYVHGNGAMSLSDFKFRADRPSKAVGYGKGAMVFHMLKQEIGEDAFFKALKKFVVDYRFKPTGWSDLETVFSKIGKRDLSDFFDQWLERTDVPVLSMDRGSVTILDSGYHRLSLTIKQGTEVPYSLSVPLVIETTHGDVRRAVRIDDQSESLDIEIQARPLGVTLDPDYDLMRALARSEFPPVLSRLLGSKDRSFVISSQSPEIYGPLADFLKAMGFAKKRIDNLSEWDFSRGSLAILGDPGPSLGRLTGKMPGIEKGIIISVRENSMNPTEVVAMIKAGSSDELKPVLRKLTHCGRYSTLRFREGKLVEKDTESTRKGIHLDLEYEIMGVAAGDLSPLDQIINRICDKQVIFVGENHDKFSHHVAQLKIIQGLDRKNRKLAVGMEMFQRPFQLILDQYMDGEIDEKTFLRKSEYLERWSYDYHIYRPIIEYCKGHDIPILALNLQAEISKKVGRKGLESLSEQELKQTPKDLNWSDTAYRTRLRDIFKEHPEGRVGSFDNFYQVQILWDETMAQSVFDYLENHPDHQMVVLAGNGHIAFGHGIPFRTSRRGKYDQAIITNVTGNNLEQDMADFFLFPSEIEPPFSAKLGVILKKEKDKGVVIRKVMRHGPAEKSGLRSGDLLLSFDGEPVKDISDLKLALLFKEQGDTANLKVKRIKRFARDRVLELTVGPFKPWPRSFHHGNKPGK